MSDNVELLRKGYEAFAREDLDGIIPLLDERIEWRNPEDSPIAGTWHGHQGVREWFAQAKEAFGDIQFTPHEFRELPDGRVLVLLRAGFRAKQSGIVMEVPYVHLITIRNGLVTRLQMYGDQHRALRAAGLPPP